MQTMLVTGASGNMGQAVVRKFIKEGYRVTGTVIPNDPVSLDFGDGAFTATPANLMDEVAAGAMVSEIVTKHGGIDAAVLTVGGFAMGDLASTSSADILKQYKLNFETTYHVARPVFAQMMQQGYGRIFMIGSKPGLDMEQGKGMTAYALAKSLIFRLAELMNGEARGTNVVTCVVVPSTLDTPQNRTSMPGADFSKWVKPEAIADALFFYCTDAAAAIREPVIKIYNGS